MKRTTHSKPEVVNVRNTAVRVYRIERDAATGKRMTFEAADDTGGKRRLRVFSDHVEARREALKNPRQLASGESPASTLRNNDAASYGRSLKLIWPNRPRKVVAELKLKMIGQRENADFIEPKSLPRKI